MEEFLSYVGTGLRPADDPFFDDSYGACKIFQRKGVTAVDEEELCHEVMREFPCHAAGCTAVFETLLDFEMHYNTNHRYVCVECKKSLPNARLLDIHIQERHDTFFKVLSEKQPMYQCYVSECDVKFNNPAERKTHCISVHKFPKNFRYEQMPPPKKEEPENKMEIDQNDSKRTSVKGKKIFLNKNQKSRMFSTASMHNVPVGASSQGSIANSFNDSGKPASLRFVPRQVKKSYTNALTNNQSNEKNVLETETLMDLANSLPQ